MKEGFSASDYRRSKSFSEKANAPINAEFVNKLSLKDQDGVHENIVHNQVNQVIVSKLSLQEDEAHENIVNNCYQVNEDEYKYYGTRAGALSPVEVAEIERLEAISILRQRMLDIAGEVAHRFSFAVHGGVANQGAGDCTWEVFIDQLCHRPELAGLLHENESGISAVRNRVVNVLSNCAEARVFHGMSQSEWVALLQPLREPGMWNSATGDMALSGLAHSFGINILLIHTSAHLGRRPLTLIPGNCYEGQTVTPIPVLMAYNGSHMESLIPVSEVDVERTRELVHLLRTDSLEEINVQDVPSLASIEQMNRSIQVIRFVKGHSRVKD